MAAFYEPKEGPMSDPRPTFTAAMMLALKYQRMRLNLEEVAAELGLARNTLYNLIGSGEFPVPTYLANGRRYADVRDVGEYLDQCRDEARAAFEKAKAHREA